VGKIVEKLELELMAAPNVGKIVEKLELELMDRLDRQRIFAQHPGSLRGPNLARRPFQANQRNPRMGVGRSFSLPRLAE
jgi:hypothetical protein